MVPRLKPAWKDGLALVLSLAVVNLFPESIVASWVAVKI